MQRFFLAIAGVLLFTAVILGAFGAHALREKLTADMLRVYETGVHYHFFHALGLGLVAMTFSTKLPSGLLTIAGVLLIVGVLLFSGSLYALSVTGIRKLGIITPFGGLCFAAAWLLFAVAALRS